MFLYQTVVNTTHTLKKYLHILKNVELSENIKTYNNMHFKKLRNT